MLKRVISGVLGIPILLAVVHYGGAILFAAIIIVALIGLYEFYQAIKEKELHPVTWLGYIIAVGILTQFYYSSLRVSVLFWLVLAVITLSFILLTNRKYTIIDASVTIYGILYVPVLLGHILLTSLESNNIVIWLIFITAWGADTCAYFSGYLFGKRKLCPNISPKKTIEGAIGGTLGTVIISGIFGYLFLRDHLLAVLFIGLIGSIVSVMGDLTASIIKRSVGIKDFGNLIPGHGGILDRFDSILFTAPVVYYLLIFMINRA